MPPSSTILESQIVDGSILARLADNETITGLWEIQNQLRIGNEFSTAVETEGLVLGKDAGDESQGIEFISGIATNGSGWRVKSIYTAPHHFLRFHSRHASGAWIERGRMSSNDGHFHWLGAAVFGTDPGGSRGFRVGNNVRFGGSAFDSVAVNWVTDSGAAYTVEADSITFKTGATAGARTTRLQISQSGTVSTTSNWGFTGLNTFLLGGVGDTSVPVVIGHLGSPATGNPGLKFVVDNVDRIRLVASDGTAETPELIFDHANDRIETSDFFVVTTPGEFRIFEGSGLRSALQYSTTANQLRIQVANAVGGAESVILINGESSTDRTIKLDPAASGIVQVSQGAIVVGTDPGGTEVGRFNGAIRVVGNIAARPGTTQVMDTDGGLSDTRKIVFNANRAEFGYEANVGAFILGGSGKHIVFKPNTTQSVIMNSDGSTVFGAADPGGSALVRLSNNAAAILRLDNSTLTNLAWGIRVANTSGAFEIRSVQDSGTTVQLAIQIAHSSGIVTLPGGLDLKNSGVALGGGSTATLGTIGGSGPTTAAQNQWVQIDINGTNVWLPVWI